MSKEDIDAILQAKDTYDKNTEKLLVFVISEDSLTDQGETFFEDFRLLVENHIGSNYKMMILTSGSPAWLFRLGNAGSYPANIVLRKDRIGPNDIRGLPQEIDKWRAQVEKEAGGAKKLQIIFHLLAHGISATGTGEGGVAIGSEQMSFSEIARDLLTPLAKKSDELIAIMEPCYGGNIRWNVPQNFLTAHNAMLVFGAPPWSPQFAPNSDRPAQQSEGQVKQARSIATLAVKKALMGFASDMTDDKVVQFADEKGLEILQGSSVATRLQERHVVRVDEFKNYVQAEGTRLNCEIVSELRAKSISGVCDFGRVAPNQLTIGPGLDDEHSAAQRKLLGEVPKGKENFVSYMKTRHPIPNLAVYTPLAKNASLNPAAGASNAILSVVNIVEFERSREEQVGGVGDFANAQRVDLRGTIAARDECLRGLDEMSGDLYDVLNWVSASKPSGSFNNDSGNFPSPNTVPGNGGPNPWDPIRPSDKQGGFRGMEGIPSNGKAPFSTPTSLPNGANAQNNNAGGEKPAICSKYASAVSGGSGGFGRTK